MSNEQWAMGVIGIPADVQVAGVAGFLLLVTSLLFLDACRWFLVTSVISVTSPPTYYYTSLQVYWFTILPVKQELKHAETQKHTNPGTPEH